MKATPQQLKILHAILPPNLRADADLKKEFIASFSEEGHESSKDLTTYEADEVIYFLKNGKNLKFGTYAIFDGNNHQHRYILSLAQQLGWQTFNKKLNKNVADLESLGSWLRKYGYLHKPLKQYNPSELPKLVTQLENVLKTKK